MGHSSKPIDLNKCFCGEWLVMCVGVGLLVEGVEHVEGFGEWRGLAT